MTVLPDEQPYVGPRPFSEGDQRAFFGREREAWELLSLVLSHSEILLYAQSGAGKTSLINAQLIPLLREREEAEILLLTRMELPLPRGAEPEEVANIYIFNVLMSWDEGHTHPAALARLSLSEFLKGRSQLQTDGDGQFKPIIIIFDQFEEFFTLYLERWQDREQFFIQIRDALDEDRRLRVVFAMREEFIGELDPYVHLLPDRLRTRFRLERLRAQAALAAVEGPLEHTGRRFAPGVATHLVDNLLKIPIKTREGLISITGQFVDPLQLQIVSQALWQSLPSGGVEITEEHLKAFGEVESALSAFYEEAISRTLAEAEIEEATLRRWFERTLITPVGTRGTVYRGEESTGGVPNKALEILEAQHILRSELRAGAIWYELAHDRLIKPIQESNLRWLMERPQSPQARLEQKAQEWLRTGKSQAGLLNSHELLEAEQWLQSTEASVGGHSEALLSLFLSSQTALERTRVLEQGRASELRRRIRRLRMLGAVLAVITLLSLALLLLSRLH